MRGDRVLPDFFGAPLMPAMHSSMMPLYLDRPIKERDEHGRPSSLARPEGPARPVLSLVVYAATESRPRQSVTHVLQQRAAPV